MDFSTALSTWKDINLTDLQRSLDATALELVENQKENMVGRKKLAEQTREFKKMPEDAKVDAIKSLLKAYQSEIDNLTRRSKASESAFLNAYKLLAEAPDPYPLLDAAVDQTVKVAEARVLESELNRLREENLDLKKQAGEVAVVEEKLRKSEARAETLEEKMDELIQERVTQKENELNATYDERMRNYEEREQDLSKQVKTVKDQLRDLRTSNDSSQAKLLDQSQRQDTEVVAKLAELDMTVADLERATTRIAAVEQRNELLRAEIESVKSGSQHVDKVKALEAQIAELESEATRLLKTIDSEKAARAKSERETSKKVEDLTKELASRTSEIEHLRAKAKQYSDYDEVKRELEIMKFVEFGGDDDVQLPDPNASKANLNSGQSLEALLTLKNKKVLEELTRMRVHEEDLTSQNKELQESLSTAQAELARQKILNERLEMDLLSVNSASNGKSSSPLKNMPSSAALVQPSGLAGLDLGGKTPPLGSGRASPVPATAFAGSSSSQDNSILPIVTSQRDRFRARNAELEEELRKQFDTLSDLRNEIKALQTDNVKLYEKVRYIGSYREESSSNLAGPSSSSTSASNSGLSGIGLRAGDEIGRYKDKYDESLNPFEAFRGREAQRAVQALNPIERAVFALCKAIIGNRRARSIFVLYAAGLHLLVMVSLWGTLLGSGSTGMTREPIRIQPIR